MSVTEAQLLSLFNRVDGLEDDKKTIADEIKETFEAFAVNNELNKKSVIRGYKYWKEAQKDQDEFCLVDYEVSDILNKVIAPYKENKDAA